MFYIVPSYEMHPSRFPKSKIHKLIRKSFSFPSSQPNGLHKKKRKKSENVVFCWLSKRILLILLSSCGRLLTNKKTPKHLILNQNWSFSLVVPAARCHFSPRIDISPWVKWQALCRRSATYRPSRDALLCLPGRGSWTFPRSVAAFLSSARRRPNVRAKCDR